MTWREAVYEVMRKARRPMHYQEVWDEIRRRKLYRTTGDSPERTVGGILYKGPEYEQVDTGTFQLRKGAARAGIELGARRRQSGSAVSRRASTHDGGAGRRVRGDRTVVRLRWVGVPFDELRFHDDTFLYAISKGSRLIYIGLSYHTDVAVEVRQNLDSFQINPRGLTIWLAYIDDSNVGRITQSLIADCERLLISTQQPEYNSHHKDAYTGRAGLAIRNTGCRLLDTTCSA